jgi:hypothetical protein
MSGEQRKSESLYQVCGWILFIICAGFFIASSIKNRDNLALVASIIFLAACLIFIIPLWIQHRDKRGTNG